MTAVDIKPKPRRQSNRPMWDEEPSLVGKSVKALFLIAYAGAILVPLWAIVATSFASEDALSRAGGNLLLIPTDLSLAAYTEIFSGGALTDSLLLTIILTTGGTAFSMVLTVCGAYALSRTGSLLHRPILMLVLFTFLFGPGMYPSFLVVQKLGLFNDYLSLILPVALSAFNLIVLRAFFMNTIPGELLDAARIDGAGEFRILLTIVLPMSKAILAVVALFYAVGYWNIYFSAVLYTPGLETQPIQVVLQRMLMSTQGLPEGASATAQYQDQGEAAPTAALKMAVVVCTVIPIVIMYPFIQKHFTKAVITGAIKG
ncbi:carbohydrate ABC transporter permease [Glycomyces algeriensis]|uniref:ABC transporter permease n=1 Tax=Glycomyces algeriensis TaxID=256037 RepID=A0A9W6GA58_9ACTN|nr:carbohydrate ABC transporter permease [Glycomyces algeriensis]MDA1364440.1 carbohydrate ABC transporter permease [Glycomyces algeriensis]MDR7350473.1 putative aldouronate transport system permease protein [Glycomyces algeriensis]GLI43180.1 ABC transporter permease [Glycomyces algeriensis]